MKHIFRSIKSRRANTRTRHQVDEVLLYLHTPIPLSFCPLKCLHSRQFHPFRTFRKQAEKQAEGDGKEEERGVEAARATSSSAMLVNHLISLRSLPSCQAAAQRWRWRWRFRQREPVSVEQQQQQLRPVSIIISVAIRGADSRQAGSTYTLLQLPTCNTLPPLLLLLLLLNECEPRHQFGKL